MLPNVDFNYDLDAHIARFAAAYGFGLIRDHPLNDGNKRAGFLAILLFLDLNRFELRVEQAEATQVILEVAAGKMKESELTNWIGDHVRKIRKS